MSLSSIKNNGFSYLNNGSNGSNGSNNGSSLINTLISGVARNNNNGSHNQAPIAPPPPYNNQNNNNTSNIGFSNLDLKQQVTDTCESFEVSFTFVR